MIHDAQLKKVTTLGIYAQRAPLGVVYSPTSDRFYVTWADRSGKAPAIEGYDARSFEPVGAVDGGRTFEWHGNFAFASGRLRISRDGTLLFATLTGGVAVYRLQP